MLPVQGLRSPLKVFQGTELTTKTAGSKQYESLGETSESPRVDDEDLGGEEEDCAEGGKGREGETSRPPRLPFPMSCP